MDSKTRSRSKHRSQSGSRVQTRDHSRSNSGHDSRRESRNRDRRPPHKPTSAHNSRDIMTPPRNVSRKYRSRSRDMSRTKRRRSNDNSKYDRRTRKMRSRARSRSVSSYTDSQTTVSSRHVTRSRSPVEIVSRRHRTMNRSHRTSNEAKNAESSSNIVPNTPDLNSQHSEASTLTHALIHALKSVHPTRSQNYFVSNFDPTIHNIEAWCEEVDRAKEANSWSDYECLSRVASCLKGDAKVWLSEWVTNDRTWTNFKLEFKPLCPTKLDYANILFEAMKSTSDNYPTYSEYARRTLLRLRIIPGLSDELRTLIVIRGIDSPQVRAATANADVTPQNLVSFLSIYTKPNSKSNNNNRSSSQTTSKKHFPPNTKPRSESRACFNCGEKGHISRNCSKPKSGNQAKSSPGSSGTGPVTCSFCKKPGHVEAKCFAKTRVDTNNGQRKVNLCSELSSYSNNNDVTIAVINGVPIDVLIDTGALNVSLISSDALKYVSTQPKEKRCVLKGISDKEIISTSYVTVTLEFQNISIEVDLVIVPSNCMNAPIILGTDVLNREGVTYIRTKDQQYLTHSSNISLKVNSVKVVSDSDVNSPLLGDERKALMNVINEFSEFLISGTAATTVKTGQMEIKLTSSAPVVYRPYKLSYQEKLKVREITRDLLAKNIIRRSQSEYASPIILVKKRDGSDRLCVDFRALNRLTVKDRYPLPLIDDHIDRLGSHKYFSSLDMATGFHQIPIKEECIHLTGFVTPEEHFEYLKMPYGLANSPIVYQRIINDTLRKLIDEGNVLVYVDDVLLLSNSVPDGIDLLRRVLFTLTQAGFSVNLKKCTFLATELEYLGRVVSAGKVKPSPRKVEALINTSPPENVRQVRQFLGLAGYFRRYIKDYAVRTACIARLTRKGVEFSWGPEQEQARQEIIHHLISKPILAVFNPHYPTEVHTDASSIGYGAVLLQSHPDGKKHVVAYFSRVTQGAEGRYHSYELETLAVVKALQQFRHYLVGVRFVVITDCNALKATQQKKDLIPRVARWWIYLQDFDFTIEYRKGIMIPHADYLSRNPQVSVNQISKPRNWAQIAQGADNETRDLLQKLQEGALDPTRYVVHNDLLCYRYTPVGEDPRLLCFIPRGHRLSLLRVFHDEHEHIGVDKTVDLILKHFWFPSLRQFVVKYVKHCLVCISKKRVPRAPLQNITSWQKPDIPFHTIHMDALGPLSASEGFKFIIIIVDAFTKYCLLYPICRQDATELKRVVTQAISLFGTPKLVVTDKGRMFESREFASWIKDLGCDLHSITPEMHHANGQVERYVRTVLNMIRIEVNHRGSPWSKVLWKLQLVINITKQKSTRVSPLNLLIGVDATTPVIRSLIRDVAMPDSSVNRESTRELTRSRAQQLLKENQSSQDERVNQNRSEPRQFNVNDLVFVIKYSQVTGKLDPGMRGPYKVTKVLPSGRYELKLLAGGYGKKTQAAAQFMVPWQGEWCPETCAAFFESEYTSFQLQLHIRRCFLSN